MQWRIYFTQITMTSVIEILKMFPPVWMSYKAHQVEAVEKLSTPDKSSKLYEVLYKGYLVNAFTDSGVQLQQSDQEAYVFFKYKNRKGRIFMVYLDKGSDKIYLIVYLVDSEAVSEDETRLLESPLWSYDVQSLPASVQKALRQPLVPNIGLYTQSLK